MLHMNNIFIIFFIFSSLSKFSNGLPKVGEENSEKDENNTNIHPANVNLDNSKYDLDDSNQTSENVNIHLIQESHDTESKSKPFWSCYYDEKWYREGENFKVNNCSECTCIDLEVKCNDENCRDDEEVAKNDEESAADLENEITKLQEIESKPADHHDDRPQIPELNFSKEELDSLVSDAHNKYDTTDLLINCCNIGSYMTNCSDSGIDNTMVNPPAGLCRSTIKHCCMLKNKEFFDPFYFKCDPQVEEYMTCCAVCKVGSKLSEVPSNFKSLMTQCCTTSSHVEPQPLIQHKRSPCKLGYWWNDKTSKCEDIDECRVINNGCYDTQECVNVEGSYYCIPKETCKAGYKFNEDILECRREPSNNLRYSIINDKESVLSIEDANPIISIDPPIPEDSTQESSDSQPIKVPLLPIQCQSGYKFDPHTSGCMDIDECIESPCQQICTNTDGSYLCSCRRGFKPNGQLCEDINECDRNPCEYECMNVIGSFRCRCPQGKVLGFDRRSCIDKFLNSTCPVQYKIHKTPEDKNFLKCVRLPCGNSTSKCKTLPKYVTYKSLTIPRNFKIPEKGFQIFNIKTKSMKVEVEHKVKINIEHKGSGVRAASVKDFSTKKEPNRLLVMLMKPLNGPQTFTVNVKLVRDNVKVMESIEIKITVQ